jgi:DNA-directed RNA polymerase subunit RPC12/RpoP
MCGDPGKLARLNLTMSRIDRPTPSKDDFGLAEFKAGMKKRHCLKCGRDFLYNLMPYFNNEETGYICTSCSMGQTEVPVKRDPQTVLCTGEHILSEL